MKLFIKILLFVFAVFITNPTRGDNAWSFNPYGLMSDDEWIEASIFMEQYGNVSNGTFG